MKPRAVERPVPCAQAFGRDDRAALQSQAAILLLLRAQVRRDGAALAARAKRSGRPARAELAPVHDVAPLRVPRVTAVRRRVPEEVVVASLTRRYGRVVTSRAGRTARARKRGATVAPRTRPPRTTPRDVLGDLARRLTRDPSPLNLAQLTRACLQHPNELPRVAAAATHFEVSTRPEPALEILVGSLGSRDPLARTLAATALSRIAPEDARLQALLGRRRAPTVSASLPDESPGPRHVRPEQRPGGSPAATSTSISTTTSDRTSTAPAIASTGRAAGATPPGPSARPISARGSRRGAWPG